jgi:teichuronic acid biosynthesis glycosyltransferase TuaC
MFHGPQGNYMKLLIVCSGNSGDIKPFIKEQAESIRNEGICVEYFLIEGKGISGYLKNICHFNTVIKNYKPDIIHAHYGLSGLFVNLQRKVDVITTFHGSDINNKKISLFSALAMKLSKHNIFVSDKIAERALAKRNSSVIPCGIEMDIFSPTDQKEARAKLHLSQNNKVILFSGAFDNPVKNYPLARAAVDLLEDNIELIELKGYRRKQVNLLLNACDVALMTSNTEGSPQFIKEAMACNCPIVSTDVGDVKEIIGNTEGCHICSYVPEDVAKKIKKALDFGKRTNGREKIKHLDKRIIAKKIMGVYHKVLSNITI